MTKKATCKITVSAPAQPVPNDRTPDNPPTPSAPVKVQDITTGQASYTIQMGETSSLSPVIEPAGATLYSCRISNSKDYVASVDDSGRITAKYPGITVVDVSSALNPDIKTQFRIQVTDDGDRPETSRLI